MINEIRIYQNEERNYGIDLLRIFAMIGIVGLHVLGHGGILQNVRPGMKYIVAWGLETLFSCCVNVYALISGYVGISQKRHGMNKISRLWFEVFFYGIVIWLVMSATKLHEPDGTSLMQAIMPVSSKEYWYFTAYVGLFCLMPLLNFILRNVNKTAATKMIIGFMLLSSYATVVRVFGDPLTLKDGCTFVWLSILYLIGGLIKKYREHLRFDRKNLCFVICMAFCFAWFFKIGFGMFGITILGNSIGGLFITSLSPPMLLMAVCLVFIFDNLKTGSLLTKIIRFTAPCTFGVYLLHDNPLIREHIISNSLISICEKKFLEFLCVIVLMIFAIFTVGILIDKLRILFFKCLHINVLIDKVATCLEVVTNKMIKKLMKLR